MKKKIISTIIAATITLLPTVAFASTIAEDVDNDDIVSYSDFNLVNQDILKDSNSSKYDINGDGKVNVLDLVMVREKIEDTGILGDVNCDGVINLDDVNLLRTAVVGHLDPVFDDNHNFIGVTYNFKSQYKFADQLADVNGDSLINVDDFNAIHNLCKFTQVKGDVNADGVVDKKDLNSLKNFLFDDSFEIQGGTASDINGDGKINIVDYSSLRHMIPNK